MDALNVKTHTTKRNYTYRYYVSPPSTFDAAKPTLLLCHGWPDSAILWKDVIPYLLKTKLRLIVPDLLGYGGTSKPTDPKEYEIGAMVEDMRDIVKAEGIKGSIIPVGHDWGAYFSSRYYMLNKSSMSGYISLNVAWMPPNGQPFDLDATNAYTEKVVGYPLFAYWELFADPAGPALMDQHLDSVYYAIHGNSGDWMKKLFCTRGGFKDWISNDRTDVELREYAKDDELKNDWITSIKEGGGLAGPCCWYRALKESWNLETEKTLDPKLEKPYLFIGCDQDAVCRTDAIEQGKQAGLFTDLEVTELHSGHWSPLEVPDQIGPIVVEWLTKKGFTG